MKSLAYEKNWWNTVSNLLVKYNLVGQDYTAMVKDEWKTEVDNNIMEYAFTELKKECSNMSKTYNLQYENYECQPYITSCPANIATIIFKIRGRILNCRDNQHSANEIITCRLCNTHIETQNHIINCRKVCPSQDSISLLTYMSPVFEVDVEQLQKIEDRYKEFLTLCKTI